MRFRGGGVGHTSTRAATDRFLQDRDQLDLRDYDAMVLDQDASEVESDSEGSNGDCDDGRDGDEDIGGGGNDSEVMLEWLMMTKEVAIQRKRTTGTVTPLMTQMRMTVRLATRHCG